LFTVAASKFSPVIVTVVLTGPDEGEKFVITGGTSKTYPANFPDPKLLVTTTSPFAPAPTNAVIEVAELTTKDAAGTPPKLTAVTPLKLFPVIVMVVPAFPIVGVKD
jgi:hypothetical protein